MTILPGEDDGSSQHEDERPDGAPGDQRGWRSHPSDADVDATFLQIVSGLMVDGGRHRHPSGNGPALQNATEDEPQHDTGLDRARRRELRRLERAQEVAAFAAREAEVEAERDADDAHFEPPEPPPLPRPKGRTIGAALMILAGIVLLAKPGLLAVEIDLTLVLAVGLILGGAVVLLTGIWRRHAGRVGTVDGAVV